MSKHVLYIFLFLTTNAVFAQNVKGHITSDKDDTVARYTSLPEVVIASNTHKSKDYGFFHLRSSSLSVVSPFGRIIVFVENTDGIDKIIQSVNVRLSKHNVCEATKIRVSFHQKTESGFQEINVSDEDIFITDFSQLKIRLDVSKYRIPFPERGIYVGLEWIGAENVAQDQSKAKNLSLCTTDKGTRSQSWVFVEEKWVQFPTDEIKTAVNTLPRIVRGAARRMTLNANFQVGITACNISK